MTLFSGLAVRPGPARLQRACACAAGQGDCEACRKKKLQRRAAQGLDRPAPIDLARFEGGGTTLAPQWRRRLEPQFGAGFDAVRIHDDAASHVAARALHAHAFTVGQHVHFAAGRFAPHTRDGLHLLAHELTHTIQQRSAAPAGPALASAVDAPDAPLEREADAQADAVLAGRALRVHGRAAGVGTQARLQRDAADTVELDRDSGDGSATGTRIRRTLEDRPCTETPDKRSTPNDKIFKWDRDADAIKLDYSLCSGSVKLTAGTTIDYTRVLEAGKNLLDTLRKNPAAGADLPALGGTALDSATLSQTGEVALTVDGILRASVGTESTVGVEQQQIRVTGTLKVTPKGVSFKITSFVDVQRTPTLSAEQYSLSLKVGTKWFAVDLGYKVDDKRPVGEAPSSKGTLSIGAEIPVNIGPIKGTLKPGLSIEPRPGEDPKVTPGLTFGGTFGGPDKTERVNCWRCECPPPLPRYTCTPYGDKKVVDRAADDKRLPLMYQFDSTTPADAATFGARVDSIGAMVGQGYEVRSVRGYASPEGKVPYNQALATRRAEHAHSEVAKKLPAGAAPLPAAEGVGELLGESSARPGSEAANESLTGELVARLSSLGPEERLNLLEVDPAARADPIQRQQALDDIQAFVDGRDAKGRRLAGRARWEKVFPFMRRVDVVLHLKELSHNERVPKPDQTGACEAADRAAIDAAHPIPPERKLPKKRCRET